jgi:hypothetical protein
MPLGRPLLFTSFLIQCWAIGGRWLIAGVGRLPRLCAVIQRRRASAHLTTAGTEIRERRGALPCTQRNGCCVRRRGGWAFDWNLRYPVSHIISVSIEQIRVQLPDGSRARGCAWDDSP